MMYGQKNVKLCTFLFKGLVFAHIRGRNYLPDNKHCQKSELCVNESIDIH